MHAVLHVVLAEWQEIEMRGVGFLFMGAAS
jgi:hypothetical protein